MKMKKSRSYGKTAYTEGSAENSRKSSEEYTDELHLLFYRCRYMHYNSGVFDYKGNDVYSVAG